MEERIGEYLFLCATSYAASKPNAPVAHAAGRVAVQADCRVEDALALMYENSDAARVSMDEIAAAVLDGSLSFDSARADRWAEPWVEPVCSSFVLVSLGRRRLPEHRWN
jgi:hypothetical protein